MTDLRRFLLLESERGEAGAAASTEAAAPHPVGERIERVEPARAPAPVTAPPQVVDRFAPAPQPSTAVEIDDDERRPKTRCPECANDSGAYDARCRSCGASLDTAAVRRLNAQLWAIERPQQEEEDAARRARTEAEIADLAAAHQAKVRAEVDASFTAILAEHRTRTRRSRLVAMVDAGPGPLARLPLPLRWAVVLGGPLLAVLLLGALGGGLALLLQLAILLAMIVLALPPRPAA